MFIVFLPRTGLILRRHLKININIKLAFISAFLVPVSSIQFTCYKTISRTSFFAFVGPSEAYLIDPDLVDREVNSLSSWSYPIFCTHEIAISHSSSLVLVGSVSKSFHTPNVRHLSPNINFLHDCYTAEITIDGHVDCLADCALPACFTCAVDVNNAS